MKGPISLEIMYDLENHLCGLVNIETNKSIVSHEQINLVKEKDPKFMNISTYFKSLEEQAFIHLFKQYQDVFSRKYDELKTYDTQIIQYVKGPSLSNKSYERYIRHFSL